MIPLGQGWFAVALVRLMTGGSRWPHGGMVWFSPTLPSSMYFGYPDNVMSFSLNESSGDLVILAISVGD